MQVNQIEPKLQSHPLLILSSDWQRHGNDNGNQVLPIININKGDCRIFIFKLCKRSKMLPCPEVTSYNSNTTQWVVSKKRLAS